jgi:hypothetical protein
LTYTRVICTFGEAASAGVASVPAAITDAAAMLATSRATFIGQPPVYSYELGENVTLSAGISGGGQRRESLPHGDAEPMDREGEVAVAA